MLVAGLIGSERVVGLTGQSHSSLGGSACYAAVAASQNCSVALAGVVSEQLVASYAEIFECCGIDDSNVFACKGRGFEYEVRYESDHQNPNIFTSSWGLTVFFSSYMKDNNSNCHDYVLLCSDDPCKQLNFILSQPFKEMALCINYNFIADFYREYAELMRSSKYVFMNAGEYNLLEKFGCLSNECFYFVTNGHNDILYGNMGDFRKYAIPRCSIIDPTGCGDAFAGAIFSKTISSRGLISREVIIAEGVHIAQMKAKTCGALEFCKAMIE